MGNESEQGHMERWAAKVIMRYGNGLATLVGIVMGIVFAIPGAGIGIATAGIGFAATIPLFMIGFVFGSLLVKLAGSAVKNVLPCPKCGFRRSGN